MDFLLMIRIMSVVRKFVINWKLWLTNGNYKIWNWNFQQKKTVQINLPIRSKILNYAFKTTLQFHILLHVFFNFYDVCFSQSFINATFNMQKLHSLPVIKWSTLKWSSQIAAFLSWFPRFYLENTIFSSYKYLNSTANSHRSNKENTTRRITNYLFDILLWELFKKPNKHILIKPITIHLVVPTSLEKPLKHPTIAIWRMPPIPSKTHQTHFKQWQLTHQWLYA